MGFIGPGVWVLELSFCPGVGNSPIKKLPGSFVLGGGVMLLYERFSRNCQKSLFVLAYEHLLLDRTPFIKTSVML